MDMEEVAMNLIVRSGDARSSLARSIRSRVRYCMSVIPQIRVKLRLRYAGLITRREARYRQPHVRAGIFATHQIRGLGNRLLNQGTVFVLALIGQGQEQPQQMLLDLRQIVPRIQKDRGAVNSILSRDPASAPASKFLPCLSSCPHCSW